MLWHGNKQILRIFEDGNVIVAGHKGRGKDLLFQYVISAREKNGARHAANIRYTAQTHIRKIKDYKLHNNGYKNFIEGNFNIEDKSLPEREDFYISDVGTALPAQCGKQLEKSFPTFPLYYALVRQLTCSNIHCNVQNYNRVWDKLREQGDYYITCRRAKVLFGRLALQWVTVYERYQSALNGVQPYKCYRPLGILPPSKEDRARANEYNAKYGSIRNYFFWHILPKVHYDTRYFHKAIYGKDAPIIDKKGRKKNTK